MKITVIARSKAKKGCEKKLEAAIRAVVKPTHEEPGCLKYVLHRSVQDPQSFVVVERWKSQEDLNQHLQTPYILDLFKKLESLVETQPEVHVFEALEEGMPEKTSW